MVGLLAGPLIFRGEFITKNLMAPDLIDDGIGTPPLADHFASYCGLVLGHSPGQCGAQIKISGDALFIAATKPEPSFRVGEIDGVLNLAVFGGTPGTEVR